MYVTDDGIVEAETCRRDIIDKSFLLLIVEYVGSNTV
jgi:hypothetical protein